MSGPDPIVHQVLDEEAQGKAKELFEQMKQNTGKVPKWMRVMANCDDILIGFFAMFKATMDNAPLDRILKWKLALIISDLNKCEFCVSVAKQQLKGFGLSEAEMEQIENLQLNSREKLAVEYGKAATEHAFNIDPDILQRVKSEFSDPEIVELASVVGLFNFINRFNDALGVLPDFD